jgi:hypothetical protein
MVIMYAVFAVALLIGIWALTCLVSALIQQGGPVKLFKGWLRAIKGG